MREEDKPFVCTRNGAAFNIMPRGMAGWLYTALWMVPALVIALVFGWVMEGGGERNTVLAVAAFVLAMGAWAALMVRWMYVRSEIIDVRKLTEEKRRRERDKS